MISYHKTYTKQKYLHYVIINVRKHEKISRMEFRLFYYHDSYAQERPPYLALYPQSPDFYSTWILR